MQSFRFVFPRAAQRRPAPAFGRLVALVIIAAGPLACSAGSVSVGGIPAPKVDALPAQTSQPTIVVHGTQAAGTVVWLQLEGQADAQQATTAADGTSWQLSVDLHAGANRFVAYATDASRKAFSPRVGPLSVELVSNVPAPTLNPVTSPTQVAVQTLSGGKGAGTSVTLAVNGAAEKEIVPADASTTWSYDLDLVEGDNALTLRSRDASQPLPSPSITSDIILDTTPPDAPVLDNGDTTTTTGTITITGTKAADGNLCLRRDQQPDCTQVAPNDGSTAINLDVSLQDGLNFLCFSSRDNAGNTSDEVCIVVTKVSGPQITVVQPSDGSAVTTSTLNVDVQIASAHSQLNTSTIQICLDGTTTCQAATDLGGGDYGASLDLSALGSGSSHTITVTASNQAGLQGTASVTFLYVGSGPTIISDNATAANSSHPAVAIAGDTLHVAWQDNCSQYGSACDVPGASSNVPDDIFYRSISASGWGAIELVSDGDGDPTQDGSSQTPSVAVDSNGNVHVVWSDNGTMGTESGSHYNIIHRMRDTSGSFGPSKVISDDSTDNTTPVIAAGPNGRVDLAWSRGTGNSRQIYYARWDSSVWSTPLQISGQSLSGNPVDGGRCANPAISVDGSGTAHIAWQATAADGSGLTEVYYRNIAADGVTLSDEVLVTSNAEAGGASCRLPAVATMGTNVVIAWETSRTSATTPSNIRESIYDTSSGTWTPNQLVSCDDTAGSGSCPASTSVSSSGVSLTVTAGGNVVAAWLEVDGSGNPSIVYNEGVAGYYFFPAATAVATPDITGISPTPAVAADSSGNVHVVWVDLATPAGYGGTDATISSTGKPDADILYAASPLSP